MKAYIYFLSEPLSSLPMYIGIATKPQTRLTAHIREARNSKSKSKRLEWIRGLLAQGLTPQMKVVDEIDGSIINDREVELITEWRIKNPRLTNEKLKQSPLTRTPRSERRLVRRGDVEKSTE